MLLVRGNLRPHGSILNIQYDLPSLLLCDIALIGHNIVALGLVDALLTKGCQGLSHYLVPSVDALLMIAKPLPKHFQLSFKALLF